MRIVHGGEGGGRKMRSPGTCWAGGRLRAVGRRCCSLGRSKCIEWRCRVTNPALETVLEGRRHLQALLPLSFSPSLSPLSLSVLPSPLSLAFSVSFSVRLSPLSPLSLSFLSPLSPLSICHLFLCLFFLCLCLLIVSLSLFSASLFSAPVIFAGCQ